MTDLSGITVTPGFLPAPLRESLSGAVDRIGAKMAESVRIDTTHFVCTEGRGREWEKAVEMNIPVVRPEWVEGCEREGRIVGVRGYYLNADPRLRQVGQGVGVQSQQQQQSRASRIDSQSTLPNRPQQAPQSSTTLEASRSPQQVTSPTSDTGPAPTPPAKDTPATDKQQPQPDTPSTVQSSDSDRSQNPKVSVTSPSEPDHERRSHYEARQNGSEGEPQTPGESTFSDVTL